jgi:hypothetical protein
MWWPQTALQAISAWMHQASDFTDALWRLQDPPRPLQRCLGRHRPCGFLAQPPFAGAHVQFVPSRLGLEIKDAPAIFRPQFHSPGHPFHQPMLHSSTTKPIQINA